MVDTIKPIGKSLKVKYGTIIFSASDENIPLSSIPLRVSWVKPSTVLVDWISSVFVPPTLEILSRSLSSEVLVLAHEKLPRTSFA
jgi:hypothetical protein